MGSLMHDGAETQEIVEAFAEHDFQWLRLSGMVRAFSCSSYCFLYILLTPFCKVFAQG